MYLTYTEGSKSLLVNNLRTVHQHHSTRSRKLLFFSNYYSNYATWCLTPCFEWGRGATGPPSAVWFSSRRSGVVCLAM